MTGHRADVAVAGAGPAGLALAVACAERGLDVMLVAPRPEQPWTQTFGLWIDEARAAGVEDGLAARWSTTVIHARPGAPQRLARGYALIDGQALPGLLRARLRAAGGVIRSGRVSGVEPRGLALSGGDRIEATAVVDATGHAPTLIDRPPPRAFQSAFGIVGHFPTAPAEPGAMTLMDLRPHRLGARGRDGQTPDPTFLYAADLGAGRWFVEETSLARARPLAFADLRARLRQRLPVLDSGRVEIEGEERCVFPMGAPLPPRPGRVIPFGAAAGMVHPASGYQVGAALTAAPGLADAIAKTIAAGAQPAEVASAGWDALGSPDRRRQRALHQLGLEALLRFDQSALQQFFATFFDLPEARWRAYLSGADDVAEVRRTMLTVFRRAGPLALPLARVALGPARGELLRALAPGSPQG